MNEKVERLLKKGVNRDFAIAMCWSSLSKKDKNELSIEDCNNCLSKTPGSTSEGKEMRELYKSKLKNFEQCKWEIDNMIIDTELGLQVVAIAVKKAKEFNELMWLIKELEKNNIEINDVIEVAVKKAKTFDNYVTLFDHIREDSPKKIEVWHLAKSKAKGFWSWYWCLEFLPKEISHEEEAGVISSLKSTLKTVKDCQRIWENNDAENENQVASKFWRIAKERFNELTSKN